MQNNNREHGLVSTRARERMVQTQLVQRGISDPRVLTVMRGVLRHLFVDEALAGRAYSDAALPIGEGQTISQPFIVARMTESLQLSGDEEVLEIGTGSGYQTAVLAGLCKKVYTIERHTKLADRSRRKLRSLNIHNVIYRTGDGTLGWPEERQFDRILVTAGAPVVPESLIDQLAVGGFMLIPEGGADFQELVRLVKLEDGSTKREILEMCRFVPLVGAKGWAET
ncbi:MAG: protein-L-isoaspartate(D-aspartate) O-methyltransferase [Magnetococcales bacterium]|nr:protein-L-isoaspartate(D-aspartate) O-methyltransferase [Magnetococcales bacterium]